MLEKSNADKQANFAIHSQINLANSKLSLGSYVTKIVHCSVNNNRLFNPHSFALKAFMRHNRFRLLEQHSSFHCIYYSAFFGQDRVSIIVITVLYQKVVMIILSIGITWQLDLCGTLCFDRKYSINFDRLIYSFLIHSYFGLPQFMRVYVIFHSAWTWVSRCRVTIYLWCWYLHVMKGVHWLILSFLVI